MKIFKISQTTNQDYDTYDSAIVAAENKEEARKINPGGEWGEWTHNWCEKSKQVTVEYLGEAKKGTKAGLILGSFNAG